ncbi:MAG: hypothetical protein IPP78_15735 [Holophagaceae bacterium]|nr:hypothetical protein [Holophagaceae bacterium]
MFFLPLLLVSQIDQSQFTKDGGIKNPSFIGSAMDIEYLQGMEKGKIVFSRKIATISKKAIIDNVTNYNAPKPPPIDHQGIDDIFSRKASSTLYFYRGKWINIQGGD